MKCLLALFLLMPSISFAQSRFDGTWEMKMETLIILLQSVGISARQGNVPLHELYPQSRGQGRWQRSESDGVPLRQLAVLAPCQGREPRTMGHYRVAHAAVLTPLFQPS